MAQFKKHFLNSAKIEKKIKRNGLCRLQMFQNVPQMFHKCSKCSKMLQNISKLSKIIQNVQNCSPEKLYKCFPKFKSFWQLSFSIMYYNKAYYQCTCVSALIILHENTSACTVFIYLAYFLAFWQQPSTKVFVALLLLFLLYVSILSNQKKINWIFFLKRRD
jgi:hypothetical protein